MSSDTRVENPPTLQNGERKQEGNRRNGDNFFERVFEHQASLPVRSGDSSGGSSWSTVSSSTEASENEERPRIADCVTIKSERQKDFIKGARQQRARFLIEWLSGPVPPIGVALGSGGCIHEAGVMWINPSASATPHELWCPVANEFLNVVGRLINHGDIVRSRSRKAKGIVSNVVVKTVTCPSTFHEEVWKSVSQRHHEVSAFLASDVSVHCPAVRSSCDGAEIAPLCSVETINRSFALWHSVVRKRSTNEIYLVVEVTHCYLIIHTDGSVCAVSENDISPDSPHLKVGNTITVNDADFSKAVYIFGGHKKTHESGRIFVCAPQDLRIVDRYGIEDFVSAAEVIVMENLGNVQHPGNFVFCVRNSVSGFHSSSMISSPFSYSLDDYNKWYAPLAAPPSASPIDAWRRYCCGLIPLIQRVVCVKEITLVAEVTWRDGSKSVVPSTKLVRIQREDTEKDLFPGDVVVPTSIHCGQLSGAQFPMEELISRYDIEWLTLERVSEGDIVTARHPDDFSMVDGTPQPDPRILGVVLNSSTLESDSMCRVLWVEQPASSRRDPSSTVEDSTPTDLQRIGYIVRRLPDTRLLVRWCDGGEEAVWRQEVSVLRDLFDVDLSDDYDDESGGDSDADAADNEAPAATADHGTQLATVSNALQRVVAAVSSVVSRVARGRIAVAKSTQTDELEEDLADERAKQHSESSPAARFSVCSMFTGHFFADERFAVADVARFARRIHQEWKILRTSLPSGIAAKSCEDSLQLLKFAIEGPPHTPYFQGFYCFDVIFREEYPLDPPTVTFHAKGINMNPNLYENGHICLSLLGTWDGMAPCETWVPTSSILQVMVSIQGLVLVKEPYYNEAGFDKKVGTQDGRRSSKMYNESAYLLHLQHLIEMAKEPPSDWSYEFRHHYRQVVPRILDRARMYVNMNSSSSSGGTDCARAQTTATTAAAAASNEEGKMNIDGLVLPLSAGFLTSLPRYVAVLAEQYDALTAKWLEGEEKFFSQKNDSE